MHEVITTDVRGLVHGKVRRRFQVRDESQRTVLLSANMHEAW